MLATTAIRLDTGKDDSEVRPVGSWSGTSCDHVTEQPSEARMHPTVILAGNGCWGAPIRRRERAFQGAYLGCFHPHAQCGGWEGCDRDFRADGPCIDLGGDKMRCGGRHRARRERPCEGVEASHLWQRTVVSVENWARSL